MYEPTLPFGKYRGWRLSQVPLGYLGWLLDECDLKAYLEDAVRAEVRRRVADPYAAPPPPHRPPAGPDWRAVIAEWFRPLAMRWHPDRGGDGRVMAALNDARERLEALVR
jgi:hypothetical protein